MKLLWPKGTKPPDIAPDKVRRDRSTIPTRMIVTSDQHYPIHDPRYEAAVIAFAQDFKPDAWLVLGDLYDLWAISRFEKEPDRALEPGGRLQEEFDAAQPFWKEVCRISNRVEFVPGNHEDRVARFVKANHGLYGLRSLDWQTMAEIPKQVKIHPYGTRLEIGRINFEHGDRIGGRSMPKHTAEWALANRPGTHTVFGHTHRLQTAYRSVLTGEGRKTFLAHNLGHGSDTPRQKYAGPSPDWTHGFAAIEWYTVGGRPRFGFHGIAVIDGRFCFGGKVYDGRKS